MQKEKALLQLKEYLKRSEFFKELSEQDVERAASYFEIKTFSAGDVLFTEGQKGDYMGIILFGSLKAVIGGEAKGSAVLSDGSIFGEVALLGGLNRTATVQALTDAVVATINRENLARMMREAPDLALKLVTSAARVLAYRFKNAQAAFKKLLFVSSQLKPL